LELITSWEYKIIKTEKSIWPGKDKSDEEKEFSNLVQDGWEVDTQIIK